MYVAHNQARSIFYWCAKPDKILEPFCVTLFWLEVENVRLQNGIIQGKLELDSRLYYICGPNKLQNIELAVIEWKGDAPKLNVAVTLDRQHGTTVCFSSMWLQSTSILSQQLSHKIKTSRLFSYKLFFTFVKRQDLAKKLNQKSWYLH